MLSHLSTLIPGQDTPAIIDSNQKLDINSNQNGDQKYSRLLQKSNCGLPKLTFNCQLAQGSRKGVISGFSNMKELYQRIGQCFKIAPDNVSYSDNVSFSFLILLDLLIGQVLD